MGCEVDTITIDFETYYDSAITLKKLNYTDYIMHPDFQIQMVGMKLNDKPARAYTPELANEILQTIDWGNAVLVCHNTPFDGFILHYHYGIHPRRYADTLAMGRACFPVYDNDLDSLAKRLGFSGKTRADALTISKGKRTLTNDEFKNLAAYCADDVTDTYKIYQALKDVVPPEEQELIHITTRLFCDPVLQVNPFLLRRVIKDEQDAKTNLLNEVGVPESVLASNQQFAELVHAVTGQPCPTKISPTTGKQTFALAKNDKGFQMLQAREDTSKLCQARLLVKSRIKETRAERMLSATKNGQIQLPVHLNYYGAHTGRWSGGNKMNMQNLTRGSDLRKSVIAPAGHVLCVMDSSQIEARTNAWNAEEQWMVDAFARGEDLYVKAYNTIFNARINKHDNPDERFVGKIIELGLGYGMGVNKFAETLRTGAMGKVIPISDADASRAVYGYRSLHPSIVKFWQYADGFIRVMASGGRTVWKAVEVVNERIVLPNGLWLHYPNIVLDDYDITYANGRKLYGGVITENIVQALARIIIADQILEMERQGMRLVLTTHDEAVVVAKESEAEATMAEMERIMRTPPTWGTDIPLDCEGGYAVEYSK